MYANNVRESISDTCEYKILIQLLRLHSQKLGHFVIVCLCLCVRLFVCGWVGGCTCL